MFPTVRPQALPQESTHLQHWATELSENNGGDHKAEPWGTWALKRTLLNIPTHRFTGARKILLEKGCFPKTRSPERASLTAPAKAELPGCARECGEGHGVLQRQPERRLHTDGGVSARADVAIPKL